MSWERRVNRVIDHVRTHLRAELSIATLARVAHASPFHFARTFKAVTGQTVVHFVQRARLERAATLMRARPERQLTEVAHLAGFSSLSDFSRVFRAHYGTSPSQWDRRSRLTAGLAEYADVLAEARERCPPHRIRFTEHVACRIGYVRLPTPFLDNDVLRQGYEVLTGWFTAHGVDWRRQPLVGLSWDNPDATPLDQVRFDLGFVLPEGLSGRQGVAEQSLPATETIQVRVQGPRPCIALAWEQLYEALARSSREPRDLPGLKRFRRRPDELGWDTFDLDCVIAVR
ncbi:MAG: AraC family transcriptional regulator [Myxococcales bacterium]|nr:AraC family transcriptional regulator [Myxococcales bacterium]